jgi:hypothetical protein
VRLHKPVYDGREVIVEGDPRADEPTELALVVLDDARTECATATAARGAGEPPDAANFPEVPLPDPVPRASVATLTDGLVLGAVTSTFDAERAGAYLDAITETLPVYRARRIAHPAWLLRRANRILARNVTLGPWIHVESEVSYFATLGDGETMSARGRVVRTWEHREHKFVTIDVAMFAGAELRPIAHVAHTAIFEPRPRS